MFLLVSTVKKAEKLATSNVDPVFKNWIDEIDQIYFMYRSSV